MNTVTINKKSNLLKHTRVFMIGALLSFCFKANAQCIASFTSSPVPNASGLYSFTNTSTGSGNVTYHWYFGDGNDTVCFNPAPHLYTNSGNYTIYLIMNDSLGMYDSISGCYSTAWSTINYINPNANDCYASFYTHDSLGEIYIDNYSYSLNGGVITNYLWDFGDGTSDTLQNPGPHHYATPGDYIICLTISTPGTTCSSTFCDSIHSSTCYGSFVSQNDVVGGGVSFTSTVSGSVDAYLWDFGDGTYSSQANPYHVFPYNGSFYAYLTVSSSTDPGCSYSTVGSVYVNSLCDANFYVIPDSVNPSNYFFYPYSANGSQTYAWSFGDGTGSTQQYPTHTFSANGAFTICLTTTSSIDTTCNNTYCQALTTGNPSSSCYASFQLMADSLNVNTYTTANSSIGNSLNYFWNFGDGSSSTLENPIHTFSANGTYSVCLTVSSNLDSTCYNTFCDYITIGNNQGSCVANFYMYPDSATGAPNVYATMNYSTGNSLNYFWNFGDGTTSTLENPSHNFSASGTYSVCLTAYSTVDSTCNNIYCETVTIAGNPAGGCNAFFQTIQDSVNTSNFVLYLNSNNTNSSYSWDFGDGTTSTLAAPTHNYAGTGPYLICLTVTNGNGCSDTYCDSLYSGRASGPLSVTVVNPMTTAIEEIGAIVNSLETYPNPFSENSTISYELTQNCNVEISVIDLVGKTIAVVDNGAKVSGGHSIVWNSEGVAEGMYLLQLKTNNRILIKKIIINK